MDGSEEQILTLLQTEIELETLSERRIYPSTYTLFQYIKHDCV